MQHYTLIFNPTAGKGSAHKKQDYIRSFLKRNSIEHRWLETAFPGHAMELAKDYAQDQNTVVIAAGGDGTCNEVLNGLVQGSHHEEYIPVMGVLPMGRGNDFAYGINIPGELSDALKLLQNGIFRPLDVGEVKGGDYPAGRYFGNGIGVGFDTLVGLEANRMSWFHGGLAYTIGALVTLIKYPKAPRILLTLDGKSYRHQPALVSVMNGKRMGGSYMMAPEGQVDDGLFNLSITEQGKRGELLKAMKAYTRGTQGERKDTTLYKASSLSIKAELGTLAVHADGETICEAGSEVSLYCHHHRLRRLAIGES